MKIIDNSNKLVEFSAIKVGECFLFDNCLFVKINPVQEKGYETAANVFCFVDSNITYISPDWHVTPVHAVITINTKVVEDENY